MLQQASVFRRQPHTFRATYSLNTCSRPVGLPTGRPSFIDPRFRLKSRVNDSTDALEMHLSLQC